MRATLILLFSLFLCAESLSEILEAEKEDFNTGVIFNSIPEGCDKDILITRANSTIFRGVQPTVKLGNVILIFVCTGIFSALISYGFHFVRKVVYHDSDNLDTTFDAGGKVTIGLTATTLVSQWTWSATLLQSTVIGSKFGISGPFWYASGATGMMFLFSILSIQLKIRSPGAKTFLQVIKARFGKATHIIFTVFAGLTNCVILALLMVGGCAVLSSLVKDLNVEFSILCFVAIIGCYTLIGGLGATFYVSYFNSSIIYIVLTIFVIKVYYYVEESYILGSPEAMYRLLQCAESPIGNSNRSFLTFLSAGGLKFGIIAVTGGFGVLFLDQSNWQSSIAAKPLQGVYGYIFGGLTWFAVPFCMATTMGLAYLALSSAQGEPILTPDEVNQGLVAPVVAQALLGTLGEYSIIFLILMAVMSTGSAEVIAITSLIVYDIYQCYIYPYREHAQDGKCLICGKGNIMIESSSDDMCQCISLKACVDCENDTKKKSQHNKLNKYRYACTMHGHYREYLDELKDLKNKTIIWVTLLVIPLFFACYGIGLNLDWLFLFMGVLTSPACMPTIFTILWARINSKGMIIGSIGGLISGLTAWLIVASTYPDGLYNFLENTGKDTTMMIANIVSFLSGGIIACGVTLLTTKAMTREEEDIEWEKTRNIDNPLSPWTHMYAEELNMKPNPIYYKRPELSLIAKTFKVPKYLAYIVGTSFCVIVLIVWPAIMASLNIFSLNTFVIWSYLVRIWGFSATIFIIIVPLVQEVLAIYTRYKSNQLEPESLQSIN